MRAKSYKFGTIELKTNIMKSLLLKSITLFFLFIVSCSSNDNINDLKEQEMDIEVFFEKVSSMDIKTSNENAIYIDYEWKKENNSIKLIGTEEKEPHFFVLEKTPKLESKPHGYFSKENKKYSVACDRGGDGSDNWSKNCGGKFSCGRLIANCLDQGGCAKTCVQKMVYLPAIKKFYLLDKDKPLK